MSRWLKVTAQLPDHRDNRWAIPASCIQVPVQMRTKKEWKMIVEIQQPSSFDVQAVGPPQI